MSIASGQPPNAQRPDQSLWQRIFAGPSTRLGRWSVGLAAVFVVLFLINAIVFMPATVEAPWRQVLLPLYGFAMLACGLAAGVAGLVAVIRWRERSWLVGLSMLPALLVITLVLGEFLVPH